MTDAPLDESRKRLLSELFQNLPDNLAGRTATLAQIRETFHQELGKALQETLNTSLARKPPLETTEERRQMAYDLNALLRSLGLAVKCQKTGLPGILVIDYASGDKDQKSRFRIEVKPPEGKAYRTTGMRQLHLPLELIPAPARIEHFARAQSTPKSEMDR